MKERQEQALVWVGIGVVIVGAIIFLAWMPSGRNDLNSGAGPMPVYAPAGQTIPQFPQELILGKSPTIGQSFSIAYSTTTNQYTAQFSSDQNPGELAAAYMGYLQSHGWKTTLNKTATSELRSISASDAAANLLVAIVPQAKGSQATITYVTK